MLINPYIFGSPEVIIPTVFATWNPLDKGTSTSLSEGNLRSSGYETNGAPRSTIGVSSGKHYWEVEWIGGTARVPLIGIGSINTSYTFDNGPDAYAYYAQFGTKFSSAAGVTSYGDPVTSPAQIVGVALDMDAGTLSFYLNGVNQGVAFTGLSGTYYPMVGNDTNSPAYDARVNFGATAFANNPPDGYRPGVYTGEDPVYVPLSKLVYATWDPVHKGSNVVLTNNNLTNDGYENQGTAKSTIPMVSGKWYWEIKSTGSRYPIVGIGEGSAVAADYPGATTHGWSYYGLLGSFLHNDATIQSNATWSSPSDVIGVAFDADNGILSFYKNGVQLGSSITGIPSNAYYALSGGDTGGLTSNVTANFGQSPFAYTPPTGYNAGLYYIKKSSVALATWDPATSAGSATLSSGNLHVVGYQGGVARSTIGVNQGKWYWEIKSSGTRFPVVGVGNSLSPIVGWTDTNDRYSYTYYAYDGHTYNNGVFLYTGDVWSDASKTLGIALDMDAGTINFYLNGVFVGNGVGLSGTYYPMTNGDTGSATSDTVANFGQSVFDYLPPAGYNSGLFLDTSVGARTYATWDPVNSGGGAALSNNNLTSNGLQTNGVAVSSIGMSSGKWYWEQTSSGVRYPIVGIGEGSTLPTNYPGGNTHGWGYYGGDGPGVFLHSGVINNVTSWTSSSQVVGTAFDADAGTLTFYLNGIQLGSPITGIPAATYFAASGGDTNSATSNTTVNFGQISFKYAPPSGYNKGLYSTAPP